MNILGSSGLIVAAGLVTTAAAVGTAYKCWNSRRVTPDSDPTKKVGGGAQASKSADSDDTTQTAKGGLLSRCAKVVSVPCSYLGPVAKSTGRYILERFVPFAVAGGFAECLKEPVTWVVRDGVVGNVFGETSAVYDALSPAAAGDYTGLYTPLQGAIGHGFAACIRDGVRFALSKLSFGRIQAPGQGDDVVLQKDFNELAKSHLLKSTAITSILQETKELNQRLTGLEEQLKNDGGDDPYPVIPNRKGHKGHRKAPGHK